MKYAKILLFVTCISQSDIYGMFPNKYAKKLSMFVLPTNVPSEISKRIAVWQNHIGLLNGQPQQEKTEISQFQKKEIIKLSNALETEENHGNIENNDDLSSSDKNKQPTIVSIPTARTISSPKTQNQLNGLADLIFKPNLFSENNLKISHFTNELPLKKSNIVLTKNGLINLYNYIMDPKNTDLRENFFSFYRDFAKQKTNFVKISLNPKLMRLECLHKSESHKCDRKCEQYKRDFIKKLNGLKIKTYKEKLITLIGYNELSEHIINFIKPNIEAEYESKWKNVIEKNKSEYEQKIKTINTEHQQTLEQKENEKKILQQEKDQCEKDLQKKDTALQKLTSQYDAVLQKTSVTLEHLNTNYGNTLQEYKQKLEQTELELLEKSTKIFSELNEEMEEALKQKDENCNKKLKEQEERFTKKPPLYRFDQRYPRLTYSLLGALLVHVRYNLTTYICIGLRCLSFTLRCFAYFKPKRKA